MSLSLLQAFFGWCTVLNVGLLIWWFLFFWLAHDRMYRFHSQLARMSVETFDAINYGGMAIFKLGIFLLNLAPYLALAIIT